uniref:Uncharacterized protein n=1 Tax=Ditylenchus dipsaci TaxID=166011 RepID=A0A915E4U7_9BILA
MSPKCGTEVGPMCAPSAVIRSEAIIYACAVDNSNKYMFTTCRNDIRIWNLETLSSFMMLSGNHTEELSCLAVSNQTNNIIRVAAGSRIASAALCHGDSLFSASRDKDIMHFSLRDFKRNHIEHDAHNKPVSAMCLLKSHSDNGNQEQKVYLTTVCREGTMKFWDITSSNRMRLADTIVNAHTKGIKDVCSNSQLLFTASDDDTIGFWHIL